MRTHEGESSFARSRIAENYHASRRDWQIGPILELWRVQTEAARLRLCLTNTNSYLATLLTCYFEDMFLP